MGINVDSGDLPDIVEHIPVQLKLPSKRGKLREYGMTRRARHSCLAGEARHGPAFDAHHAQQSDCEKSRISST